MSEEWKAMSADAKAKYEAMCTEDKGRYNKEMTAYNNEKKANEEKKAQRDREQNSRGIKKIGKPAMKKMWMKPLKKEEVKKQIYE